MRQAYLDIERGKLEFNEKLEQGDVSFLGDLRRSWVYHDFGLEGVPLTRRRIHRVLEHEDLSDKFAEKQIDLLIDRFDGAVADLLANTPEYPIDVDWLKQMHTELCAPLEDAKGGRYRQRDSSPGVYYLDIVPASSVSYHFRKLIDEFEGADSDRHPVEAASEFHWKFMEVFPFDEHTGMVGRLATNAFLMHYQYPPAIIHETDRDAYFAALEAHPEELTDVLATAITNTIDAAKQLP